MRVKEEAITLNYEEKRQSVSKTIENWQFRRLKLLGKIVVIKNLLSPFPRSSAHLEEIKISCNIFLWHGKRDKIKGIEMFSDFHA